MAYDADAHVAALRPPAFTAGGRTFVGRILSVEEVIEVAALKVEVFGAEGEHVNDLKAQRTYARRIVGRWFPRRWYQLGNPAYRAFRRLPDRVQLALLADFSESQRSAMPQPLGMVNEAAPAMEP